MATTQQDNDSVTFLCFHIVVFSVAVYNIYYLLGSSLHFKM
jgi:hypothetical protein